MISGLGSSSLANQRLTELQTGFAQTLGAGWEPVLVWKLSGQANAAVTQSSTQHQCRAASAGSAAADRRACTGVGRGQSSDQNGNV